MGRAVALLTSLLLLHLSLVGGDHTCDKHGRSAPQSSQHATEGHHATQQQSDERDGCDKPASSECCIANASCGPIVGVTTVASLTAAPHVVQSISSRVDAFSVSRWSAPDTPPPRA
jgi:hypothetical protein